MGILKDKMPIPGTLVATFDRVRTDRGMVLAAFATRCVRAGEVHELLVVLPRAARTEPIQEAGYLGFVEFLRGGVIEVGDEVVFRGLPAFAVLGFDETHAPNHMNIVLTGRQITTGHRLGLEVGDVVAVRAASRATLLP